MAIVPISQKERIRVPFDSRARILNVVAKPVNPDFFPGRPRLVVIILICKRGAHAGGKQHREVAFFASIVGDGGVSGGAPPCSVLF